MECTLNFHSHPRKAIGPPLTCVGTAQRQKRIGGGKVPGSGSREDFKMERPMPTVEVPKASERGTGGV